jgi:carboxylesterase type B
MFARGEGPGLKGFEPWPEYEAKNRSTMIFGIDSGIQNAPRERERKIWDKYY